MDGPASPDEDDLMTRLQVARLFGVTSAAVANWAHRKTPVLTEIRNADNEPRYRRAEVDKLYKNGFPYGVPRD